jgi:hypothetical protein
VRSHLITTFGGCFGCINCHFMMMTKKVSSGIPMVWVEVYAPRAGFVHPHDGLILWAYSVTVASMKLASMRLGHGDVMSWERVNRFVGNEIEHDMEISLIESRTISSIERQRDWDIMLRFIKDVIMECRRVSMTFQSPLLIIDRREVAIISGVFPDP